MTLNISAPWRSPLLPFQEDGVRALLYHKALLLADDMGLGKTIQTIAALRILFNGGKIKKALIITPAGLILQWRRELYDWAPEVSALRIDGDPEERRLKWSAPRQIFLSSYETLRNDVSFACRNIWDVIILDEAQKIKNRNAAVSRICKRLPRTQAWALTGTPLENCEDDLASVLEFVRENPGGDQLPPLRPGYRLREMQENFQLRRRKKDVLKDLPPRMLIRVPLELTASQRQAYTIMKQRGTEQLVQLGRKATVINVLELITRLKQICNFCPETGSSVKADDLHHRLKSLRGSGHRALIFSQWTSEHFGTGRLEKELKEFRPLAYTGTLLQAERAARIEMFKRDTQHTALILSLRAGGQGLNLQEATYVFHFDRWWNPAVENQASDRAHRMGQKHAVTVYAYTCIDTIEERIEQILESKRALFAALVDQVSLDVRKLLSAEELFGLFGLTAPVGLVTKKSSGQAADLLNRLQLLLRHNGWTDICKTGASSLHARRYDEIGTEKIIAIKCLSRWDDGVLEERADAWDLVVCPEHIPEKTRGEARAQGIALLDDEGLRCIEEAAGLSR